ncbi:MAG: fluoride efflux transporter CrcB [Acidobacteria bacterium]|nr:fluoride efflux transporter CrcB [Acidobacteriota bacterium]
MNRLLPYLLVGVGGFLGANARYVTAKWVGTWVDAGFPLGTFLINMSGSFLLGLLGGLLAARLVPHGDDVRLALGVGFLGAFTTFSTFEFETHALFEDGVWLTALSNIFLSLFLGLLAVRVGLVVAKSWMVG